MELEERMRSIQLILSDVDGVMTTGQITYDNEGIETKSFHVRDGMGIKLWQRAGHRFGVVTARSSHIVKVRMAELGVDAVRQGSSDKIKVGLDVIQELGLNPQEVCYVGDDLTDLGLLKQVGLAVTIADGVEELKSVAHWITEARGGHGALRELIEKILKVQQSWEEVISVYRGDS